VRVHATDIHVYMYVDRSYTHTHTHTHTHGGAYRTYAETMVHGHGSWP